MQDNDLEIKCLVRSLQLAPRRDQCESSRNIEREQELKQNISNDKLQTSVTTACSIKIKTYERNQALVKSNINIIERIMNSINKLTKSNNNCIIN